MSQMPEGPAAQSAYRVPRSFTDSQAVLGQPLPPVQMRTGVVTSVGATTCCVQISDDEVCGVIFPCSTPSVGDVVEIEMRNDLWVIPCSESIDTYLEGVSVAEHAVSSEEPAAQDDTVINIAGQMTDLTAWVFINPDDGNWDTATAVNGIEVTKHASGLFATNHIITPSMEAGVGTVPWVPFGGTSTMDEDTSQVFIGTKSGRLTWVTGAAFTQGVSLAVTGLVVGQLYLFSGYVYVPGGQPRVGLSTGGYSSASNAVNDQWVRLFLQFIATDTTQTVAVTNLDPATAGQYVYVDALSVVDGNDQSLPYFDGDTVDTAARQYAWTAFPNASTSTWTEGQTGTVPPATLWSLTNFEVTPGDVLHLSLSAQWLAQANVTVQTVVAWGDSDSTADPGTSTQVDTDTVSVVLTSSGPGTLTTDIEVPETITTVDVGVDDFAPGRARIGFLLTPAAGGLVDLVLLDASLTMTVTGGWPLGSLWLDPDASSGGVTTLETTGLGTGSWTNITPTTLGAWFKMPGVKKAVITAPPASSGVLMVVMSGSIQTEHSGSSMTIRQMRDDGTSGPGMLFNGNDPAVVDTVFPYSLTGLYLVDPGGTVEVSMEFIYSDTSAGSTPHRHTRSTTQAMFLPSAVAGGDTADANLRWWDGDSWRPPMLFGADMDLSADSTVLPPSKPATSTSVAPSQQTVKVGEQSVTLTSTTTPAPTSGTVRFERANTNSGPWTSIGTATVSATGSGQATKLFTPSGSDMGRRYFRAIYLGNSTHAPSTSAYNSVRCLTQFTAAGKINCGWVQAYSGSGSKVSGSGADTAVWQGYNSSASGQRKSLLRFNNAALTSIISSASAVDPNVTSCSLECDNWSHWDKASGQGTVIVGWHTQNTSSAPASWPASKVTTDDARYDVDEGHWKRTLSNGLEDHLLDSNWGGITIGPAPTQANAYLGHSDSPGDSVFHLYWSLSYWA